MRDAVVVSIFFCTFAPVMRFRRYLLPCCALLALLLQTSCGGRSERAAMLLRGDSLMSVSPGAALGFTDSLIATGEGGDHWQAQLQLRRLNAQNKLDTLFNSRHVDEAKALVEHFDRSGTPNERLLAHYLLGRTLYDSGKVPDALEAYHAAVACADTTATDCDYRTLSFVHTQMAVIFHRHYQSRTTISELQKAQRMAYLDGDTLMAIECYFDQSAEYDRLGETDTAFAIATEAARRFAALGQHDRAAAAKSSTVLMLLDQQRTAEAKAAIEAYLSSAYTDSLGNVNPGREIFYYKRGLYYLQAGWTDSAEYYFRKELRDGRDLNNQIAGRKGLQLLYERLGRADSVARYAAEGYSMSDSVYMVSESQNLQSLQTMFDYTRHQKEAQQKSEEAEHAKARIRYIIIIVVAVALIVAYLITRQRKKQKALYKSNIEKLVAAQSDILKLKSHESDLKESIAEKEKRIEEQQASLQQAQADLRAQKLQQNSLLTAIGEKEKQLMQDAQNMADLKAEAEKLSREIELKSSLIANQEHILNAIQAEADEAKGREEDLMAKIAEKERIIERQKAQIERTHQHEKSSESAADDLIKKSPVYKSLQKKADLGARLTDEEWLELDRLVIEALPGFYDLVSKHGRELTTADYQTCVLDRLFVDPHSIHHLIGISDSYVTKIRIKLLATLFDREGKAKDFDQEIRKVY